MQDQPLTDSERAELARVLESDPRVRFAYLFGSRGAGTHRGDSDVDLAVSIHPRGTLFDDARLHDDLVLALGRDDVDLLVLEDAALWMAYRAVAGTPVYIRDPVARVRHRARVEHDFLDFKPFHDSYLAAIEQRARAGTLSRG